MKDYSAGVVPYVTASHDIWDLDNKSSVLKLDWNEATVPPSPYVIKHIKELVSGDFPFQWYPNTDNKVLIKKLADYIGIDEENVQIFPSSDVIHEYVSRIWFGRGDKVGIVWPSYDNFRATVEVSGGQVVYVDMPELKFDLNIVKESIIKNSLDLLYIANPNNPTGEQIDVEIIEELLAENPNCMFLIDEAYSEFSRVSSSRLVSNYENIIITRTFSKAFGLASFRVGYLISSPNNVKKISKIRNSKNVSTLAQEAVTSALDDIKYMENYVDEIRRARSYLIDEMNKWSYVKKVYNNTESNFLLLEFENESIRNDISLFLKSKQIYVRCLGQTEYLKKCIRVTIGTVEQMEKFVNIIKRYGV